jgi:AcrR family transcriptional regulator
MARKDKDTRKGEILAAAVKVAERDGYQTITREKVAREAGVTEGLVSHHLGTMKQLKRAVMRYAINNELLKIVGIGVVLADDNAMKAPIELQTRAKEAILK